MFDIGFWEIILISIIGLVVLGPQRLPIAIKTVVRWVNTAKRMANSVKSEISQELELHEMNENMIKATKQGFDEIDGDLKASINEMKESVNDLTRPYQDLDDAIKSQQQPAAPQATKTKNQTAEAVNPQPTSQEKHNK